MSGHTPGPWVVGRKAARLVFAGADGQGAPICECSGADETPRSEEIANGRLIAAAPELLEALSALLDEAEDFGIADRPFYVAAKEAIGKATGSQP